MKRSFGINGIALAAVLFSFLGAPGQALPPVSDAPSSYAPPDAVEVERVREAFRDAAARSAGRRSGQIFALGPKYGFVAESRKEAKFTHIKGVEVKTDGMSHGGSWEYDTRIPMTLWGPGFIRSGIKTQVAATLQDLVPTCAALMGAALPVDAQGRVLEEALQGTKRPPKVILTVVFDQAGQAYLRAHPGATPMIDRLKKEGTDFQAALVTHLDSETGIGHAAIGTGAWPGQFGLSSNNLWMNQLGGKRYAYEGERDHSSIFLESPTLADVWLRQTKNKALVASYCYADRAVIGMLGHGSLYRGNKKPYAIFYDERAGQLKTNPEFYAMPDYLKGASPSFYLKALTNGTNRWMGHAIDPRSGVRATPAYVEFDGDNVVKLIEREPFGKTGFTDLLYVTFKSSDAAGHVYGHESDEAAAVLQAQDKQLTRIIEAMVAKVGAQNLVVVLTADHGSTPLPELSGGLRLSDKKLLSELNRMAGAPVFEYASATQLFVNEAVRRRFQLTYPQLKQMVLDFRVDGKAFFVDALTREEALERSSKFEKF